MGLMGLMMCGMCLAAAPEIEAAEALRVYQLPAGYYAVQGQGIVRVQILTPDSPVVPDIPDVPTNRLKELKTAAEAATADPARVATAANLAAVAALMQNQISAGSLKEYQTIAAAYDYLSSQMIGKQSAPWEPFQTLVGNHLARLAQEGAQPEEYAGFFDDVGKALEQSVAEGEQVMAIDMAVIMKLLMWFMENILPLIIR